MDDAFLDIETSWEGTITVIGIHRYSQKKEGRTVQLVAPEITPLKLKEALEGTRIIYTYNGSRFDLPVIRRFLGVDLSVEFKHHDLMYDCWEHNLYGGLKRVEQMLGISRSTDGVSGIDAMNLWQSYINQGDKEALRYLLLYNREDVENLVVLAGKLCR